MSQQLIARSFSFVVATVMTLGMLGGIDRLSQNEPLSAQAPQWALSTASSHA